MALSDDGEDARGCARRLLHDALMSTFGRVLSETGLSPIAVMTLAAEAVGASYRQVAEAHSGIGACDCGWRPLPSDLPALQAALTAASTRTAADPFDLHHLMVMGRA